MAFVKIIKNKAYSMRMQVKPKRRRLAKTDYYARRRLTCQDKNKYDSRKYRLVARRTCSKIITQIIYSTMTGDKVMCAADSTELKVMGLTAGLTNYSAAYCTGLLIARRLLKQVKLDSTYSVNTKVDGEYFNVEDDCQDKRPFKAFLDVGIPEPLPVPEFSELLRVPVMEVSTSHITPRDSQVSTEVKSKKSSTREVKPLVKKKEPRMISTPRSIEITSSVSMLPLI